MECPTPPAEDGFSLIEVVVAMLLLVLLAVVTLPLFMSSVAISARNTSATSGTAAVGSVLDQARGVVAAHPSGACAALRQFASSVPSMTAFQNAQGRTLSLTMTVPACTPGTPAAVTVTVAAPDAQPSSSAMPSPVEPSATTIIYLGS